MTAAEVAEAIANGERVQRKGRDYVLRCPAHDDTNPSLWITEADDGKVLLTCRAGCENADILRAAGISAKDLFNDAQRQGAQRIEIASYPYVDEDGHLLYEVVRYHPKTFRQRRPDPDVPGRHIWSLEGVRRVLYRLPKLLGAPRDRVVYVVEGEKDVHAIEAAGGVATCNVGGAGKWKPEYNDPGIWRDREVRIVADNDEPGLKHAQDVATQLQEVARRVTIVHPAYGKDASDHLAAGLGLDEFGGPPPHPWQGLPIKKGSSREAPTPSLYAVDGGGLIYPGHRHIISGPTETYKSFLAMDAAARVIADGGVVMWWDWEMSEDGVAARAELVGIDVDAGSLLYRRPSGPATPDGIAGIVADTPGLALVVADSYTGLLQQFAASSNDRDAVEQAHAAIIDPLRDAGVAVILIDHVNKNTENRGVYSTGTPRKVELADVHIGLERASKRPPVMKVTKHKDRPYGIFPQWGSGEHIGTIEVHGGDRVRLEFVPRPDGGVSPNDPQRTQYFRPTTLMQRCSDWLFANPGSHSVSEISKSVTGANSAKRDALHALAQEGFVEATDIARGGKAYHHVRAFDATADEANGGGPNRRPDTTPPDPSATPPQRGPSDPSDPSVSPKGDGGVVGLGEDGDDGSTPPSDVAEGSDDDWRRMLGPGDDDIPW